MPVGTRLQDDAGTGSVVDGVVVDNYTVYVIYVSNSAALIGIQICSRKFFSDTRYVSLISLYREVPVARAIMIAKGEVDVIKGREDVPYCILLFSIISWD